MGIQKGFQDYTPLQETLIKEPAELLTIKDGARRVGVASAIIHVLEVVTQMDRGISFGRIAGRLITTITNTVSAYDDLTARLLSGFLIRDASGLVRKDAESRDLAGERDRESVVLGCTISILTDIIQDDASLVDKFVDITKLISKSFDKAFGIQLEAVPHTILERKDLVLEVESLLVEHVVRGQVLDKQRRFRCEHELPAELACAFADGTDSWSKIVTVRLGIFHGSDMVVNPDKTAFLVEPPHNVYGKGYVRNIDNVVSGQVGKCIPVVVTNPGDDGIRIYVRLGRERLVQDGKAAETVAVDSMINYSDFHNSLVYVPARFEGGNDEWNCVFIWEDDVVSRPTPSSRLALQWWLQRSPSGAPLRGRPTGRGCP